MKRNGNRNLWQCDKLFRGVCPNNRDPAMKLVVMLVQEMFTDMTDEAIRSAEALCVKCKEYVPKPLHSEK